MSEDTVCENCGDPNCKCPPGKCTCTPSKKAETQPSDKYLPKEDKGNIETGKVISKPVNPYKREALLQYKPEGSTEAITEPLAVKALYASALENLNDLMSFNEKLAQQESMQFHKGKCIVRIAKDGCREVRYAFVKETKHPYSTQNAFASTKNEYLAYNSITEYYTLSRHLDDKSASEAAKVYNTALGL